MSLKVRKTLTLDREIVEVFGDDPGALSAAINTVLHDEVGRRRRRADLAAFVAVLDAEFGAPDAAEVDRFRQVLS
jgi:hypothetical protein